MAHRDPPAAAITAMAPWEEADSGSRAWQVPTHPMRVMRELGLRLEPQGHHGAGVSIVNIQESGGVKASPQLLCALEFSGLLDVP